MASNDRQGNKFLAERRRFNQGLLVSAALAAVPAPVMALQANPSPFEIQSQPGVKVHVAGGKYFELTVLSSEGDELERHTAVSATSIHSVTSPYFKVRRISAPTAA